MKNLMISVMALFFAVTLSTAAFAGDNCKNVKLQIKNNRAQEIKVTKVEYYDYDKAKWRSESIGSWNIASKVTKTYTRDLENVKNDNTTVKLTYKYNTGGSSWSSEKTISSSKTKCTEGKTFSFTIN